MTEASDRIALYAHDIRGALTVIGAYANVLESCEMGAEVRARALTGIEAAVRRADTLLGELLGTVAERSARIPVPLAPLVEQAAEDCRAGTDREVLVRVDAEPVVTGDPVAISRVLENLLGNALKYAPSGAVEISLSERDSAGGRMAVVAVADRGPGIPTELHEEVVRPRSRLERDAGLPGSGLGLAIVDEIVRDHGGRLTIGERDGGGAVISVELPVLG